MALSKSTITGRVPLPTDENLQFAELTFALSGLDTEGADVLPGGISTRIVLIDSDIPPGFELWQNMAGLHGTHYRVLARWTVKDRDGVRDQYADIGIIQIGSDPSYTLADLINNGVAPAIGTFWSAITQAQYDAVIQSAADAQASAVAAALYEGPWLDTVSALLADTSLTYTPAQPSTVSAGDYVRTRSEGFAYEVAASGASDQHLTTAGGVKLYSIAVISLKSLGAVGDGATDDTSAWNKFNSVGGGLIEAGSYLVSGVTKRYVTSTYVTTADSNHASGRLALESLTTGFDNVAFGDAAMQKTTTGNRNTAIGLSALAKNTIGDHNIALGQNALGYNLSGTYNTALGIDALQFGDACNFNIAIGQYAALNLTGATSNTVAGYNTFATATSGNRNAAYGKDTLANQSGVDGNTAIGTEAGRDNISGTYLVLLGHRAARSNTTGTHITAIGDNAAYKNTTGTHNIAVGYTAVFNNVTGSWNTALGDLALFSNTASYNTGVGGNAGYSVTTGSENTFIGYNAGFNGSQKADAVNTTAIGRGAWTTKDNTVQLGNPWVVGVGVGANKIEWLSAVPATGTYARGDVVWNLAATAGGVPGWICVAAGTPGTWKAFGTIAV